MTERRGFTLLEMMIVVAIVALVAAMIVPNFNRRTEGNKVEATVKLLRHKVERARLLSTEIGPRLGETGGMWVYNGCTACPVLPCPVIVPGGAGYMWSYIGTNGDYSIPAIVTIGYDPNVPPDGLGPVYGRVTVTCDTGTLADLIRDATNKSLAAAIDIAPKVLVPAAGNLTFSFSGTGRVCFPGGAGTCNPANFPIPPGNEAAFILQNNPTGIAGPTGQQRYGFRLFQSGLLCSSSVPGANPFSAQQCDTD